MEGTVYAVEYPVIYDGSSDNEPYYPILTSESQKLYRLYKDEADKINNLVYCGRLADFKYYNMDQALARALKICDSL